MHEPLHHRPRKAVRPGSRQRQIMYAGTLLLLMSGLLWLLAHYALPLPEDAARHPAEPWAMRIHGAATLFGVAMLGSIWTTHVMPAWQRGSHRLSGGLLFGLWLLLALSGYGLYYLADEGQRGLASGLHIALGLALPAGLAIHVLQAMADRKRASRAIAT
jgi:hypothetical protein